MFYSGALLCVLTQTDPDGRGIQADRGGPAQAVVFIRKNEVSFPPALNDLARAEFSSIASAHVAMR